MEALTVTRRDLSAAFREWAERDGRPNAAEYGRACASYLTELIEEANEYYAAVGEEWEDC